LAPLKRSSFLRNGGRLKVPASKKPGNTLQNAIGTVRRCGVARQSRLPENHFSLFVDDGDARQGKIVGMGIQPEGVTDAPGKADGAAPGTSAQDSNAGRAVDRGKDGTHENLLNLPEQRRDVGKAAA
jgi:hypothetical protein